MKAVHWIIAAAALSFVQPAPANAGVNDPEVIIYRFPGVYDEPAGGRETATVFQCTNFSGVTENMRFVTRRFDGQLKTNVTTPIAHLATTTVATHDVNSYVVFTNLATGQVTQGTTAIAATSTNIICTAMTIDALDPKPTGIALRGIRFLPVPGSQE